MLLLSWDFLRIIKLLGYILDIRQKRRDQILGLVQTGVGVSKLLRRLVLKLVIWRWTPTVVEVLAKLLLRRHKIIVWLMSWWPTLRISWVLVIISLLGRIIILLPASLIAATTHIVLMIVVALVSWRRIIVIIVFIEPSLLLVFVFYVSLIAHVSSWIIFRIVRVANG